MQAVRAHLDAAEVARLAVSALQDGPLERGEGERGVTRRACVTLLLCLQAIPRLAAQAVHRPRVPWPIYPAPANWVGYHPAVEGYYTQQLGVRFGELLMLRRYGGKPKCLTRRQP